MISILTAYIAADSFIVSLRWLNPFTHQQILRCQIDEIGSKILPSRGDNNHMHVTYTFSIVKLA